MSKAAGAGGTRAGIFVGVNTESADGDDHEYAASQQADTGEAASAPTCAATDTERAEAGQGFARRCTQLQQQRSTEEEAAD